MPTALIQSIAGGLIRTVLAMAGGYLVAHGALTSADVAALSPQIQDWLGSGVVVLIAAWSAYAHSAAHLTTAAKEEAAVQLKNTTTDRAGLPTPPAVQAAATAIVQQATGKPVGPTTTM